MELDLLVRQFGRIFRSDNLERGSKRIQEYDKKKEKKNNSNNNNNKNKTKNQKKKTKQSKEKQTGTTEKKNKKALCGGRWWGSVQKSIWNTVK